MKFTVQRNILLAALTATGKAIGRSTTPLMECYRIAVVQNACSITGSNLEVFLRQEIEVSSQEELINICLPADNFLTFIKNIPDQPLYFEISVIEGEKSKSIVVDVIHSGGRAKLQAEPGELYPKFPDAGEIAYQIPAGEFFDGVSRTVFAIDPTDNKEISNYCIRMGNGIVLSGISSPVFSVINVFRNTINSTDVVISKSCAAALSSLPYKEDIELSYTESNLIIDNLSGFKASFIRVNGSFPKYESLLDVPPDTFFKVETEQFEMSLRRVMAFADKVRREIKLTISDNLVAIETFNDNDESCREALTADVNGSVSVGFNCDILLKSIQKIKSEYCRFYFTTHANPMLLTEVLDAPSDIKILLAPLMLNW